ncbi:glycoside hydrolase family 19 protein [Caulobacter soli]|uniref:glycoside hydrolase family 19 protein n=1 Tax=Caulobacter soli TaxID=2708539 RepID=UPI0013EA3A62|nr:glycoside hydrolase family 19 protein [Caulobacter soli]
MEAALSPDQKANTLTQSEAFLGRLEHALKALSPKIGPLTLATFLGRDGLQHMERAGILDGGGLRLAFFLSQGAHESTGFTVRIENLNYTTAGAIQDTWPKRFKTAAAAEPFVRRPAALANSVYRNRNGNTAPDDGWRYRGRGFIQLTGRDNYVEAGKLLGWPLVDKPQMAEDPAGALATACAYWRMNNLNRFADLNDFTGLTRAINGGEKGLKERRALLAVARRVLDV